MKPLLQRVKGGLAALLLASALAPSAPAATPPDPLAAELASWLDKVRTQPSTEEIWLSIKGSGLEILTKAEQDLAQGRRLLALERLARARAQIKAAFYLLEREARGENSLRRLEREWARLEAELAAPSPTPLGELRPALVRALAEVSLPQAREYFQASLEYGRNTEAASGFFYLGAALSQRELPLFLSSLAVPTPSTPLALRPLDAELEALENELLTIYRPPASIDRHAEFITTSATLKEAKEANAAGLYHGALLTYLKAVERLALLKGGSPRTKDDLSQGIAEAKLRLEQTGTDSSLGQLFLETASSDLESPPAGQSPQRAAAILREVMPKYFAALGPAPPPPPHLQPQTQVTLVRWPYT